MPNKPMREFPLRHNFGYHFNLQEFETTHLHDATSLPLYFADQTKTDALAEAVQVNPANDTFENNVQDPACFMNSRVNKIKITEFVSVNKANDVPDCMYFKSLHTWGLGDADTVAADGSTILALLKMTKGSDTLLPTYTAGSDLDNANLVPASIDTLDTSQLLEAIDLNPRQLYAAGTGELGAKVRSIVTRPSANRVHKDFPYYMSRWYNTPPKARRMNAFTGCYLYVAVEVSIAAGATVATSSTEATHFDTELTIDEGSIDCHYFIEFNEYNDAFDMAP